MGLRHITAFLGAVLMAGAIAFVAFLAAAVEPEEARAATKVKTCGGRSITLSPRAKRTLMLHNKARMDRGLKRLCVDLRLTVVGGMGEVILLDHLPRVRAPAPASAASATTVASAARTSPRGPVSSGNRAPSSSAGWTTRITGATS
jgi:hypothetical protein